MQMPSNPSRCMSRKFSMGKLASRSYFCARGARTRRPNSRALAISSPCEGERRNASGAKIGRSGACFSSGSCMRGLRCGARQSFAQEAKNSAIELLRRLEVGEMPNPGQARVARARDLARQALHHACRGVAVMLAGKAKHRHLDATEIGALVESQETTHRRLVGGGGHRCHAAFCKRAPARIRRGADEARDDLGCELRHAFPSRQRLQAVRDELPLKLARGVAEGGTGAC